MNDDEGNEPAFDKKPIETKVTKRVIERHLAAGADLLGAVHCSMASLPDQRPQLSARVRVGERWK